MKKYGCTLLIVLLSAAILAAGVYLLICQWEPFLQIILADDRSDVKQVTDIFAQSGKRPIVILDAGHGGEDAGAVGIDGVLEKDLNLSLTLCLRDLLIFEGWQVILTRDSDVLLYDPNVPLSRKTQDLKNRLDYSKRYDRAVFVSIHMNKFPDPTCKGLQVYYSGNHPASQSLAQRIQTDHCSNIAPENHRKCKVAGSSIYLMHRMEIPAVLIECGFLSNAEDVRRLTDRNYQKLLAAQFAAGLYQEVCQAPDDPAQA